MLVVVARQRLKVQQNAAVAAAEPRLAVGVQQAVAESVAAVAATAAAVVELAVAVVE